MISLTIFDAIEMNLMVCFLETDRAGIKKWFLSIVNVSLYPQIISAVRLSKNFEGLMDTNRKLSYQGFRLFHLLFTF